MCFSLFLFFFFKQKTAYEMRISDWSSDVCSSDLLAARQEEVAGKAVLHGDHVTDEAQLLDPFKQDDLHDWPSLFHDEGQEADMARALDRLRQLALLLGGNRSDAAGDDLAALGHEALEQTDVLIVDLRRVLAGKGAGLAATEKWACHVLMPFLRCHVVAFATWAAITTIPAIATITSVAAITTAFAVAVALAHHDRRSGFMRIAAQAHIAAHSTEQRRLRK